MGKFAQTNGAKFSFAHKNAEFEKNAQNRLTTVGVCDILNKSPGAGDKKEPVNGGTKRFAGDKEP